MQLTAMKLAQLELLQRAQQLEQPYNFSYHDEKIVKETIVRIHDFRKKIYESVYESVKISAQLAFVTHEKNNKNSLLCYLPTDLRNELSRFIAGTSELKKFTQNNSDDYYYKEYQIKNSTSVLYLFKGIKRKMDGDLFYFRYDEILVEPWVILVYDKKNNSLAPFQALYNEKFMSGPWRIEFALLNSHHENTVSLEPIKAIFSKKKCMGASPDTNISIFQNDYGYKIIRLSTLSHQNVSLEKIK